MKKSGSAKWCGTLKEGRGHVSTESGALLDQPYGFATRFEDQPGTNPEELVGAAHAACFSMALSKILEDEGLTAEEIEATATVTLGQKEGAFAVTDSHLTVRAKVPGADDEQFHKAADKAKENCPISKLLNARITMDAMLA